MPSRKIAIEASGRHVHLSTADLETLFGKGYELTLKKELSQPGQFLSEERVKIEGPKGFFDRTAILGPVRPATQVEVSLTDARTLGVEAPIRESGDVKGSGSCRIIGPKGQIEISEGVIVAKRHLHITPEDAASFGVKDKQTIKVKVGGERGLIFDEVVVRVSPKFATSMHIDFDEANAVCGVTEGEIID